MSYIDLVVDIIKDKGYIILEEPKRASIIMGEMSGLTGNTYLGSCIKFKISEHPMRRSYTLFVSDKVTKGELHNGYSIFGESVFPDVCWFKEPDDILTIVEGFYI